MNKILIESLRDFSVIGRQLEEVAKRAADELERPKQPVEKSNKLTYSYINNPFSLTCGVFRIFWTSGGSSLASVGCVSNGDFWMAPCNWTSGITTDWSEVDRVEGVDFSEPVKTNKCKYRRMYGVCQYPNYLLSECPHHEDITNAICSLYEANL